MRDNGFLKMCPSGNIMLNTEKENAPSPHGHTSHSTEEYDNIMELIRESYLSDFNINPNLIHPGNTHSLMDIELLTKESGL